MPDPSRPAKPLKGNPSSASAAPEKPAAATAPVKKQKPAPAPAPRLSKAALEAATLRQKAEVKRKEKKSVFQVLAEMEPEDEQIDDAPVHAVVKPPAVAAKQTKAASSAPKSLVGGTKVKSWADATKKESHQSPSREIPVAASIADEFPSLVPAKTTSVFKSASPPSSPVSDAPSALKSPGLSRSSSGSSIESNDSSTKSFMSHQHIPVDLKSLSPSFASAAYWQQQALEAQKNLATIESEMSKIIGIFDSIRGEYENKALVDQARYEKMLQEQKLKASRMQMAQSILTTLVKNQVDCLVPEEFFCPISLEIMQEPVVTTSGHSYERSAIERFLKSREEDPLTRHPCSVRDLRPNYSLKTAIESWKRNRDSMRVALNASQMYSMLLTGANNDTETVNADASIAGADEISTPAAPLLEANKFRSLTPSTPVAREAPGKGRKI